LGVGSPVTHVPVRPKGKLKTGTTAPRVCRARANMRAMFLIYLTLIVAGLVGFTLIGVLQR